ncbi:MAG: ATPase [Alphaproteobacteria bacterium]|nr:ATPase [Alphaproteobacteria bacterium]
MKRFYRAADIAAWDGAFEVVLDGRPVRSPGKRPLVMGEALARAVAAEWAAQGATVALAAMPLMLLAGRAVDVVGPERARIVGEVAGYGRADTLCYRAETPSELVRRQDERWQPWLDWAADALGARLIVARGVMFAEQPPAALAALARAVEAHDDWRLAALMQATHATGSLVLGLALVAGRIEAKEAAALAALDEMFQIERWGEDAEAAARRAAVAADVAAAAHFVALLA